MTNNETTTQTPLSLEFETADFGDFRLTRRLGITLDAAMKQPDAGFPAQAASAAELEGTYRFLNNENVTPDKILEPHIICTGARCLAEKTILVVHDTTEFSFDPDTTRDLGYLHRNQRGFLGHFSLAVSAEGARRVLGILNLITLFRPKPTPQSKEKKKHQKVGMEGESRRWLSGARDSQEVLSDTGLNVVHVMDREGDSFGLLAHLLEDEHRFVIRLSQDRLVKGKEPSQSQHIFSKLESIEGMAEREVPINKRTAGRTPPDALKQHPVRQARLASLNFSATRATLLKPRGWPTELPKQLTLNFVRVWEPNPPEGEVPIEWRLMTTEAIETPEQILAVVDAYRTRWVIEEFFKALKTGTAYEKRQVESRRGMLNALAILAPVAWRLLNVRTLGRSEKEEPATMVLTETQIQVLRAIAAKEKKHKLPRRPTVQQAMLAIAILGGYIKSKKPPGWQTLGRGFETLLLAELGWRAHAALR